MFWKKERKVVNVEFIDSDTNQTFARSEVPLEALPASFEADTTLTIKEENWSVVRAEPVVTGEALRTGLRLWLRKENIQMVNPADLLYSLPTLNDELPGLAPNSSKLNKRVLEMHEDDWRQIEFISLQYQTQIEDELKQIRRIYQEESAGAGFRSLHVRSQIPRPLTGSEVRLSDFPAPTSQTIQSLEGVAFAGIAGLVDSAFTLSWGEILTWYGLQQGDVLETLCLAYPPQTPLSREEITQLASFAASHQLCLVDWCRALQLNPGTADFAAYFQDADEQ